MDDLTWTKSSRSCETHCVEVAASAGKVHIRDSKDPDGPTLTIAPTAWRVFIDGLKP